MGQIYFHLSVPNEDDRPEKEGDDGKGLGEVSDDGEILNFQAAHSLDRMMYSIIIWIEYLILLGVIVYVWKYGSTPYDLNLSLFLPIVTSIFLTGQILEWKYHISYPFSEVQNCYSTKKFLMYGVMLSIAIGALAIFFYYTFNEYDFPKMFLAFLVILALSLLTLFMATFFNKLVGYCSKPKIDEASKENNVKVEQNKDTQEITKDTKRANEKSEDAEEKTPLQEIDNQIME